MGPLTPARTTAISTLLGGLCLAGSAHAVDPYQSAPPYGRPRNAHVTLMPILTTGQLVPLTGGPPGSTYRFVGLPDGLGAVGTGGSLTLLCNHEFGLTLGGPAGPLRSGARVSELAISYATTPTATIVSARNYIAAVYAGEPPALVPSGTARIARLCSASMSGAEQGFDRPILLHGEEASGDGTFDGQGGSAWATFDQSTWQLRRLGHAPWENIIALAGTGERTVILGLKDGSSSGNGLNSQVYMYVGQKVPASIAPLERNGFSNGQLYVLAGESATMNSEASFHLKGTSVGVRWAPVNYAQSDDGLDAQSRAAGSFLFVRVEDGASDPRVPGDFYFVTTGAANTVNPYGRLYRLRLDPANPLSAATLTLLLDGTEGIVSPDNIAVNAHGELMICEDPIYNLSRLSRDGFVWMYHLGGGGLNAIAEIDRGPAIAHALAADPLNSNVASTNIPGGWEWSGVMDAEAWTGRGSWLVDVQAHSLRINPTAQTIEGGQVLLLRVVTDLVDVMLSDVEANVSGAGVELAWRAGPEVQAVHVWRAASVEGPWEQRTPMAWTREASCFTDAPDPGVWYYRLTAHVDGVVVATAGPYRLDVQPVGQSLTLWTHAGSRGETDLHYTIPGSSEGAPMRLAIFDVRGRLVASLRQGTAVAGSHLAIWYGQRLSGAPAAAGVYIARLETNHGVRTSRVVLMH